MRIFGKLFGKNKQEEKTDSITHKEEWDSYFTHIDNILGSVLVDLGIKAIAPVADKPNLVWVSLKMNNPREDGLSSNDESTKLYEIEDALVDNLVSMFNCMYVGRTTTNGHRNLYFYFEKNSGYNKPIADTMKTFPDYSYNSGSKEDREWNAYSNFLYPLPVQYQGIMNRRVVQNLAKNGDDHNKPRKVDHFLYFNSEKRRADFIEQIKKQGFAIERLDVNKEAVDYPYSLHLSRVDKVDINSVNEYTIDLWEQAPKFDGYYDGWGCPIEK